MFALFMRYGMSSSAHVDNNKKENLILGEPCTRIRWYNINCRKKVFKKVISLKRMRSFA